MEQTLVGQVTEFDMAGSVAGDLIPLIPTGVYLVTLDHYKTQIMFGRQPKLIMGFRILEGEHTGVVVAKFYNVRKLKSKAGPRGKFEIGRHSDYLFDYAKLHGLPPRLDRMPMQPWRNSVLKARVKTVKTGRGRRELPEALQYSKIESFVEKVAG